MRWIFVIIISWLTFVVSLSGWWLIYSLRNLTLLAESNVQVENTILRHQRMLFFEGCVLVVMLILGGIGLLYFSYRMYKEKSAKEKFFATFAHDIKTGLFRLQLMIEKIGHKKEHSTDDISKVLAGTRNLQLDLENGLDTALGQGKNLYIEKIDMQDFLSELHAQWPELSIQLKGEGVVYADRKALQSVFKNLIQNSCLHGQADQVVLELEKNGGKVTLYYSDNGQPFEGSIEALGEQPSQSVTGSGFGLFLAKYWMKRMSGDIAFNKGGEGRLAINMFLPGV